MWAEGNKHPGALVYVGSEESIRSTWLIKLNQSLSSRYVSLRFLVRSRLPISRDVGILESHGKKAVK